MYTSLTVIHLRYKV